MTIEQLEYYKNTYDCFDGISSDKFENICDELIEYKKLEEQLGCPLKIRIKVNPGTSIYDKDGNEYLVEFIEKPFFIVNTSIYMSFKWKDYKVTWWLKEDRSE